MVSALRRWHGKENPRALATWERSAADKPQAERMVKQTLLFHEIKRRLCVVFVGAKRRVITPENPATFGGGGNAGTKPPRRAVVSRDNRSAHFSILL
jgi:hypothetical protein